MKSKPSGEIIIRDNMSFPEINQIQNNIKKLKGNEILRERKTILGKNKEIIYDVYKNTFSERSFNKLQKIKNNILNEKLAKNSILTKGIFGRNSISADELSSFLDKKKEVIQKNVKSEAQKIKDEQSQKDKNKQVLNHDSKGLNDIATLSNDIKLDVNSLDDQLDEILKELNGIDNPSKDIKSDVNSKDDQLDEILKELNDIDNPSKDIKLDVNSKDDQLDKILKELNDIDNPSKDIKLEINAPNNELDEILKELENSKVTPTDTQPEITKLILNKNPKELVATVKDNKLENLKDKFEAQSTKINTNLPSSTTSIKVSPALSESEANAQESHSVLEDLGLIDNGAIPKLKPRENNNIGTVNNLKDSRTIIKQEHIDNLKKAIDFDNMKFDKNESIGKDLTSQKEYIERYIDHIASLFTLKESERKSMDEAIFSDIKITLNKEFEFLINMAKDNVYQSENWVKRTADLNSALKLIDFIPDKYHSENWAKMTADLDSALLSIDFIPEKKSSKVRPELSKNQTNAREMYSVLKDLGLRDNGVIEKLKSRDKNNSVALNNLKDSPTIIKQEHIDNLKKAIDFDGMQFDTDKPNYEQLNRQKEFLDTTIKLIASTSTLKKNERITEGRGSLSNLKLELKREFQNLLIMANNNGY